MLGLAPPVQAASARDARGQGRVPGFAPDTLDALRGDTILWTNNSGRRHTVTADSGSSTPATYSMVGDAELRRRLAGIGMT
jgi:plastocyanin